MEKKSIVTRPERLGHLGNLCQAIAASLPSAGPDSDFVFRTFRELISAECVQCGARIPGEELFVLSQPADREDLTGGLRRLRLGYCADSKCQSYHCQLSFQASDKVDWRVCLAQADRIVQAQAASRAGRSRSWRSALIRPTAIAVVALLLIFLWRQLYIGGRIPLIREPEKFRVDPVPVGEPGEHVPR